MKSTLSPLTIKRVSAETDKTNGTGLHISWNDGKVQFLSNEKLRRACPCATCTENRGDTSHSTPLTPKSRLLRVVEATADEALKLSQVWAIGNYAIGARWGDGHDTGIYPYSLLRALGDCPIGNSLDEPSSSNTCDKNENSGI